MNEKRRVEITQEESKMILRALSLLNVVKRELGGINQSTLAEASYLNEARMELVQIDRLMNKFYW